MSRRSAPACTSGRLVEHERGRGHAADHEPADVPRHGDPRHHLRDHQVEHDDGDDLAVGPPQPHQHQEQAAHQPEDGAGRARHVLVGVGEEHDGRGAAEQGHQVERQEPAPAEHDLQIAPQHPQREHVERDVQRADVQEPGGDEPPPLALGDGGGHERPRAEQRGVGVVEQAARLHGRPGEDGQVQRDERGHHDRAGARRAAVGRGWGRRRPRSRRTGSRRTPPRRQSGQAGRPQREQASLVARSGWRTHAATPAGGRLTDSVS